MKKYLIKVNGNQYEVEVEEIRQGVSNGTAAQDTNAQKAAIPKATPVAKEPSIVKTITPAGAATIIAPMPGTVLRLNIVKGDSVKKGQVLLILEAMKMENEILAPNDGIVASINTAQGASVNVGEVLVSLN